MDLYPPCFRAEPIESSCHCLPQPTSDDKSLPATVVTYCRGKQIVPWLLGSESRKLKHLVWYGVPFDSRWDVIGCPSRPRHVLPHIDKLCIDQFACAFLMRHGFQFPNCKSLSIDRRGHHRTPISDRYYMGPDRSDNCWLRIVLQLDKIAPNIETLCIVEDYGSSQPPFRPVTCIVPDVAPCLSKLVSLTLMFHACGKTPGFEICAASAREHAACDWSPWKCALPQLKNIYAVDIVDERDAYCRSSCFEKSEGGDTIDHCFVAPSFSLLCWPRGPVVCSQ